MALIPAKTLLVSISLFHVSLGFFFLANPRIVSEQAMVFILGEAFALPRAQSFNTPSPALAFSAAILMIFGITDLITLSLPEETAFVHWNTQAPLRVILSLGLLSYIFLFSPSSPIYGGPRALDANLQFYEPSSWGGDEWKNRVFFSFIFIETISWFWLWVTLQEEKREVFAIKGKTERSRLYHDT